MKKRFKIALVIFFFVTFFSEVSAQYVNNVDSLTRKSCIFVNAGLQESFLFSESAFGANFSVGFGASWGRKISFGVETEISDWNMATNFYGSGGRESVLKNLSNVKIGPSLILNIKKMSFSTTASVGWLTGSVEQYKSNGTETKRGKSEISLVTLGVSERISYSFVSWKNMSVSAFVKVGIDAMKDCLLLRPKGKITYAATGMFGIEISIFPKK
ncbi:MAG TPA: hypothetical protein PLO44_00770 [Candidatus Paceibacterota bacterium]|nr:hypothetical protein [Candidatus Paceibacterota bacterium]